MKTRLLFLSAICIGSLSAQNYTSYFTGNVTDAVTQPSGGICMMGGATENDSAMVWFLNRADGGDVLVLRASGSNGYNDYLYSDLGVTVNSVETIVCNNAAASDELYIQQKIEQAEAIWFAGGDQWNYVSYWRNTAIDSLINRALTERNIVIGGTSAGMAILGKYYFSAQNGSVTSAEALADPYNTYMTVDSAAFLKNTFLDDVITDTHYDDPDRKGRHAAFLGRILVDYDVHGKGIACDEYTSVCIAPDGIARVYGEYPAEDDNAYFIQVNCDLVDPTPESCVAGSPFTWNNGLKVYKVKGTMTGANTLDLNDWKTGSGGDWQLWSAGNGSVTEVIGLEPDCPLVLSENSAVLTETFPNPTTGLITINCSEQVDFITVTDIRGNLVLTVVPENTQLVTADLSQLEAGVYFIETITAAGSSALRIVKQ